LEPITKEVKKINKKQPGIKEKEEKTMCLCSLLFVLGITILMVMNY
jgi:hypothetical protein